MLCGAMEHLDNRELGSEIIRCSFEDPAPDDSGGRVNIAFFAALLCSWRAWRLGGEP
jgi:hypothetical protein